MGERKIWANVILKDGKILFWWTGDECNDIYDFNKDFYYAGLSMSRELATGRYLLRKQRVNEFDDDSFYRNFELHEDFKGRKPYKEGD